MSRPFTRHVLIFTMAILSVVSIAGTPSVAATLATETTVLGLLILLPSGDATTPQDATPSPPHVPRQGTNLIVNPLVNTKANWSFLRDSEYDASTSRADDGSGAMKLVTPLPKASMVLADLIAVQPGKRFTYGFYFKTLNGPTYVGAQISLHDSNRKFIRNHASGLGGTSQDGQWQEYALPFIVPEGVAFVGCQAFKGANTQPGGVVWADEFYLGEGLGLAQPPAAKKPFNGAHVRVDALGNFEIKKNGEWTPIFPLCMYSDNYALQGTFNNARVHAARGLVDVSGTYLGGSAADTGGAGQGGDEGLFILDRHERQTSPAAFAQFNGVDGPGDMRLRLYNSIILGAKAMGYWRDCYQACDEDFMKSVGPADKKPWWPDFPNLRREVDKLLPIIREPHWTSWKASVNAPDNVRVGTRNHNDEGYVILVNQTTKPQEVSVRIEGLPYDGNEVREYFSDEEVASIRDGSFTLTLPKIGVGSGTTVLRLVRQANSP